MTRICDCKYGYCTGYLPKGLKVIRCVKKTNVTNEECPACEFYEVREPEKIKRSGKGCCGEGREESSNE